MSNRPTLTEEERLAQIDACLVTFATARGIQIEVVREEWRERSAIRQYQGGLRHRRNADLHAVGDAFDHFPVRKRTA